MDELFKYVIIIAVTVLIGFVLGYLYKKRKKENVSKNTDSNSNFKNIPTNYQLDSEEIIFGDITNPDIVINPINSDQKLTLYEEISIPSNVKAGFQSLLHQAPNLASSALQLSRNVYEVIFSPQVMEGLNNGSMRLMQTVTGPKSIAMGKKGILEQGNIISGPGANPAMIALAVWQVLSIVTAQKFLSDINENLKKIENNIASIKSFLEKDRTHKIVGNIKYLSDIANTLQNKELNESDVITYSNQIENIERECLYIHQSLNSDLEIAAKKFEEVQFKIGMFGPSLEKSYEIASQSISEFHNYSRTIYMSIYLRTIAAQLKNSLPVDRSISQIRLNTIKDDIKELLSKTSEFERKVHNKIPTLKSKLRFKETDKAYRKNLKDLNKTTHTDLYKLNKEVDDIHQSMESRIKDTLNDTSKPYKLMVETDKNKNILSFKKLK